MKKLIFFGFLIVLFTNCSSQSNKIKEESTFETKSPELKEILLKFNSINNHVNYIYNKDTAKIEFYLQIDKNGPIKRVPNFDNTPEVVYCSFNIIKDLDGKIIYISEEPFSESGDWDLSYENYYDDNGNLIAFVRKSNFFNGECAEIVKEKSEYFYNIKHELIKKDYQIKDGDGNNLDFNKCIFNYRFDYNQYKTLVEFLQNHNIQK